MDWIKKLCDVIDYIEEHLEADISIERCAEIASCSPFYFQRLFSYMMGLSLSEYIKKRRMTQAGFLLKTTDEKIIDIALKFSYSSASSFTRAFKDVHGITPSEARSPTSILKSYPKIKLRINVSGDSPLDYSIKDMDAFRILALSTKLSTDMEENQKRVPLFWKEILNTDQLNDLLSVSPQAKEIVGVTEVRSPDEIYYHIGVLSKEAKPSYLNECLVPRSTWAVFENQGNFRLDVQSVFKRFYKEWLPFSGYRYGFLPDIEIYPLEEMFSETGRSKVLISIEKECS